MVVRTSSTCHAKIMRTLNSIPAYLSLLLTIFVNTIPDTVIKASPAYHEKNNEVSTDTISIFAHSRGGRSAGFWQGYTEPSSTSFDVNCYYCNMFMGTNMRGAGGQQQRPPSISEDGDDDGKILNGRPAGPGEFPYVVAFERQKDDGYIGICGGTILDARHVITAAHCMFDERKTPDGKTVYVWTGNHPSKVTIRAGTTSYSNSDLKGTERSGEHVCVHKAYDKNVIENGHDIAVLRLSEDFDFSNEKLVRGAKILWEQTEAYGDRGTIVGWGLVLDQSGTNTVGPPDDLQKAEVYVYKPRERCQDSGFKANYADIMCAGTAKGDVKPPPAQATGTCAGDSGSPLSCSNLEERYDACGLVSYTTDSCKTVNTLGKRTLFTKMAPYGSWVYNYVKNGNMSECYSEGRRYFNYYRDYE